MTQITIERHLGIVPILLVLALAGCTIKPIRNVSNAPVITSKAEVMLDEVGGAIRRAGIGLGWGMQENSPGSITGTLRIRTHIAIVEIKYDTKNYSINYSDSTELKYDAEKQTINKNYNQWIQNLDNAIAASLVKLM